MAAGLVLLLAAAALFALVALEQQRQRIQQADQVRQVLLHVLQGRLEEAWQQLGPVKISAAEQGLVLGSPRRAAQRGPPIQRITLGIYSPGIKNNPSWVIERYFPLINHLETESVSLPFVLDLVVYREFTNAVEALVQGKVGFMRASPAMYVLARQQSPSLKPLVEEAFCGAPQSHGAIFTRNNSSLQRLQDLRGGAIGFGDADSAIASYVPKAALLEAGLDANSFTNRIYRRAVDYRRTIDVVNGVLEGEFAAGVAESSYLAGSTALRELMPLHCPNYIWVGTTNLPPQLAVALKECLLDLRNLQVLGKLPGLTGFLEPCLEDYNELELQIEKARQFDAPQLRR
jgi:ABC-type phosphate/phosphonate transport system substrate-binding protein